MSPTEILCELIAIPSVNPMGRELSGPIYFEQRVSDWLVRFFESIGANHERIEVVPGRANVIARYNSPGARQTLLFDAHQDTVPIDNMTIAPFAPTVVDGRITGRGAADVKGGLAAMLYAFARVVKEKPKGGPNLVLSCSCDEEFTTVGIRDLVSCWQDNLGKSRLITSKPDGAIVAEPTDLDVVVAHRGVTRFRVHTLGRACHSSDPTQGRNAIYTMARAVRYLEDYASWLPKSVPIHSLCGRPTLSVGRIFGGQSVNIVPDSCTIEIDRRLVPGEDPKVAWSTIREQLTERFGPHIVTDEAWISSPALNNSDNAWLAEPLLKCIEDVAGKHRSLGVAYCTHASTISTAGVPAVVFGPGSIAQAHTDDEFIEIKQLDQAAEIYFQVAQSNLSR
ncbi:MAG: M20 family metallopeptidase [Pirellulaceae bacterium]|nr:M20 family metallopeptidase [Pirellulaceae bacterium]